jgi:hypothetical protein
MAEEKNKESSQEKTGNATGDGLKGEVTKLESILEGYMVKKAPFQIPAEGKEFIAKISPYLIIIGAVMFIPALLALLGIGAVLSPFAMMGGGYGMMGGYGAWSISLVFGVVAFALEIMALSGLFKRTKASWRLVYYATLVSLLGSIVSFNIIGGIIGAIISWYILFQVKELYKN